MEKPTEKLNFVLLESTNKLVGSTLYVSASDNIDSKIFEFGAECFFNYPHKMRDANIIAAANIGKHWYNKKTLFYYPFSTFVRLDKRGMGFGKELYKGIIYSIKLLNRNLKTNPKFAQHHAIEVNVTSITPAAEHIYSYLMSEGWLSIFDFNNGEKMFKILKYPEYHTNDPYVTDVCGGKFNVHEFSYE
jgi:hypothetical protein